jgi:hypothetical protein
LHIESTYPLWLVLPLVALAVFVVWMLYYRNQQDSVLSKPLRMLLSISRALVLVIVGLLIISPWIRTTVSRQKKPSFIVARDNSVSIPPANNKDSFVVNQLELRSGIIKSISNRFQVKEVLFGSKVLDGYDCDYTDPLTDPGELFDYLQLYAKNHDLGGVLLTTDGVSTRGETFLQAANNFPYPLIILGSGDSTRFPDVRIQDVVSNEWVRKNNNFPVRVYYNLGDYKGHAAKIQITGPTGIIDEKTVETANRNSPYEEFVLKSSSQGVMRLSARIVPDTPDKNQDNNFKDFTVKIIEQQGEILCLYQSAHPDINAFMQALRDANSLNISVYKASEFPKSDKNYDLVILHGLPSMENPLQEFLSNLAENQVPILYVIGNRTDPVLFNRQNHGMVLDNKRRNPEAAKGTLNASFSLFLQQPDFAGHLNSWPPLSLNFEVFMLDPGSHIFMKQKIMSIEMEEPLVAYTNNRGIKYGFVCGEGIWLWRMHEFLEHGNYDYFDEWLSKSIQYLMTDEKKERFRVVTPEELYAFSTVRINAYLLNKSLEAINNPDVLFSLTDSVGQVNEYQMGKVNSYYELNISGFAPGTYRYTARTKFGEEEFSKEGSITLLVRPIEQTSPVADFGSLNLVATNSDGRFFSPGQKKELLSYLDDLKISEVKVRKEFKWYDLINFKWLLPLLVALLAMEWFLRRWFGIR